MKYLFFTLIFSISNFTFAMNNSLSNGADVIAIVYKNGDYAYLPVTIQEHAKDVIVKSNKETWNANAFFLNNLNEGVNIRLFKNRGNGLFESPFEGYLLKASSPGSGGGNGPYKQIL